MKLREWATPLTIGAFGLMSVTGLLMFFHFDMGLNKPAHQWLGWAMVAGVAAHAAANWNAFKRYFVSSATGRAIIGLSVLVLAGSFVSLPGGKEGASPPVLAMRAIAKAPISTVAPLSGRSTDQLLDDLAKAGVKLAGADSSLDSVTAGNREMQGKAMGVLFGKR
jgi:hypothetical protein